MGVLRTSNMNWAKGIFGLLYSPSGDRYFDQALSQNVVIVDKGIDTSRAGYIQNMEKIWDAYDYVAFDYTGQSESENFDSKTLPGGQALALFFALDLQPKTAGHGPVRKVGSINLVVAPDDSVTIPPEANEFSFDNRRIFKLNVVLGIFKPSEDS